MNKVVRFSVSLDEDMMRQFDRLWKKDGFPTRSEAVKAMISQALVQQEWQADKHVAGAVVLVYDHHKRNLTTKLNSVQHDFEKVVVAVQHAHLDHNNCLEAVIVKGNVGEVEELMRKIKSVKGLKHAILTMTTAGQRRK